LQRNLLEEVGFDMETSILYQDNNSASTIIESRKHQPGVKHVDLKFHFIKQKYQDGTIKVIRKDTADMTADIFTKALNHATFLKHIRNLGLGA
jgi:hypothetical protein